MFAFRVQPMNTPAVNSASLIHGRVKDCLHQGECSCCLVSPELSYDAAHRRIKLDEFNYNFDLRLYKISRHALMEVVRGTTADPTLNRYSGFVDIRV